MVMIERVYEDFLVIKGTPIAQKRHKYNARGNRVIVYDPSAEEKKEFAKLVTENWKGKALKGAVGLSVVFYMPRPKSHFRTGKHSNKLKPTAPVWVTTKPDIDNCIKFVLDACNGILWEDDKTVCEVQSRMLYSHFPRTEMEIWEK
jgi:Holliday junction resolvase RusA-like endonuclease